MHIVILSASNTLALLKTFLFVPKIHLNYSFFPEPFSSTSSSNPVSGTYPAVPTIVSTWIMLSSYTTFISLTVSSSNQSWCHTSQFFPPLWFTDKTGEERRLMQHRGLLPHAGYGSKVRCLETMVNRMLAVLLSFTSTRSSFCT